MGHSQRCGEEVPLVNTGWLLLLEPVCLLMQRFPSHLMRAAASPGEAEEGENTTLAAGMCDANGSDLLSDTEQKVAATKEEISTAPSAFSSESLLPPSFTGVPVVVAVNSSLALRSWRS